MKANFPSARQEYRRNMLWMLLLIFMAACGRQPAVYQPVTIAFPLTQNPDLDAIRQFQELLMADTTIHDMRLEGLPQAEISIKIDREKAAAMGVSVAAVNAEVETYRKSAMKPDDPNANLARNAEEMGMLRIPSSNPATTVMLRDIATIEVVTQPVQLILDGEACVAIRGETWADSAGVAQALQGLDSKLGTRHFVQMGHSLIVR